MKKIIYQICKILISGVMSIFLLSVVCLAYSYNMLGIPTEIGTSDFTHMPDSFISNMEEGFYWDVMDANGYNNDEAYSDVDVLIMGGSNIEALQMNRAENVTHKLDEMLPQYHVYQVGMSAHTIEKCAYYFENACDYFSPRYVVVDLNTLELDESAMVSTMNGTYVGRDFSAYNNIIIRMVYNYIPVFGTIIDRFEKWTVRNTVGENVGEEEVSIYEDSEYMVTMKTFLRYIGNIAKEYDIQLILLYHPANYDVSETGELKFNNETYEWEIFQKLCEENDIVLVSTKDEYIRMYKEDHVVPNGFSNTRLGIGHINKYGHTAMANVLYETIKDLEN